MTIKVIATALLGSLFVSCAAVELQPGAGLVVVSREKPPSQCRYIGAVVGSQGGALSGTFTSNTDLLNGAINDLRNQVKNLGGNYAMLQHVGEGSTLFEETDTRILGAAYECSAKELNLATEREGFH